MTILHALLVVRVTMLVTAVTSLYHFTILLFTWEITIMSKYILHYFTMTYQTCIISWTYSCCQSCHIRSVYSQCHADVLKCTEQNQSHTQVSQLYGHVSFCLNVTRSSLVVTVMWFVCLLCYRISIVLTSDPGLQILMKCHLLVQFTQSSPRSSYNVLFYSISTHLPSQKASQVQWLIAYSFQENYLIHLPCLFDVPSWKFC